MPRVRAYETLDAGMKGLAAFEPHVGSFEPAKVYFWREQAMPFDSYQLSQRDDQGAPTGGLHDKHSGPSLDRGLTVQPRGIRELP